MPLRIASQIIKRRTTSPWCPFFDIPPKIFLCKISYENDSTSLLVLKTFTIFIVRELGDRKRSIYIILIHISKSQRRPGCRTPCREWRYSSSATWSSLPARGKIPDKEAAALLGAKRFLNGDRNVSSVRYVTMTGANIPRYRTTRGPVVQPCPVIRFR